ncbi:MAG: MucR family transcriptional regulator [Caulobacterales bacterium]
MNSKDEEVGASKNDLLRLSADIVAAYVGQNSVTTNALQELIGQVHGAIAGLGKSAILLPTHRPRPAVPIARSVQYDHIVCLEDGKKLKMLKRYLRSRYDFSPEDYRRRWGLGADYPMVAPAYAERRSAFAKKIGLGRGVRRKK